MAGRLHVILGDQLTPGLSALRDFDKDHDHVLMIEVHDETTYVKHHKQKIVMIISAMRHFSDHLRKEGMNVRYTRLDDKGNTGSFTGEVVRAVKTLKSESIVITMPGEHRVMQMIGTWHQLTGVPVDCRDDDRFFSSPAEFAAWAKTRKELRMEFFYREMRKKSGILMQGQKPEGGQWNYDAENRKALSAKEKIPERLRFDPDDITRNVMAMVEKRFADHPGSLEHFGWPVTRDQALKALDHFIQIGLPRFGDVQDAMKAGAPFLFHALLSPALNCGLLLPLEVCRAAERAYHQGHAPLNAVEGFIRQILGWREYVRGLYWHVMPDYVHTNALEATRPLPEFYWTGETDLHCISQCVKDTMDNAYAHHIQRLMVLGNFALLAGIRPHEVEAWFLAVYADAYEWVELPNVHGMALYADGGLLASKPYAASGAYIDRMSDYCSSCRYSPKAKEPERICPFTPLYWNFLERNRSRLSSNPRLFMPYRGLDSMAEDQRARHRAAAETFLASL